MQALLFRALPDLKSFFEGNILFIFSSNLGDRFSFVDVVI